MAKNKNEIIKDQEKKLEHLLFINHKLKKFGRDALNLNEKILKEVNFQRDVNNILYILWFLLGIYFGILLFKTF